jgi:hypothetical protein
VSSYSLPSATAQLSPLIYLVTQVIQVIQAKKGCPLIRSQIYLANYFHNNQTMYLSSVDRDTTRMAGGFSEQVAMDTEEQNPWLPTASRVPH